MINISKEDFGLLCVCAIRYCMGRTTRFPYKIQGIVQSHLSDITDKDIDVMMNDCAWQKRNDAYGDEMDKPGWLKYRDAVQKERKRRC